MPPRRGHAGRDALMAGLPVLEYDAEGHVVSANAPALAALGLGAEDIVGKHHRRLIEAEFVRTKAFATPGPRRCRV